MSTPGNTAKLRAIHSNLQTTQSNPSLVGSEPTMHTVVPQRGQPYLYTTEERDMGGRESLNRKMGEIVNLFVKMSYILRVGKNLVYKF